MPVNVREMLEMLEMPAGETDKPVTASVMCVWVDDEAAWSDRQLCARIVRNLCTCMFCGVETGFRQKVCRQPDCKEQGVLTFRIYPFYRLLHEEHFDEAFQHVYNTDAPFCRAYCEAFNFFNCTDLEYAFYNFVTHMVELECREKLEESLVAKSVLLVLEEKKEKEEEVKKGEKP